MGSLRQERPQVACYYYSIAQYASHGRIPRDQVKKVTGRQVCDQANLGQAERPQDSDQWFHPGPGHCLCCGIYAGDWDSYKVFADVFDPLIQEYHGIAADAVHTSDMDVGKIKGNIDPTAPVHSTRIRVGRSIDGFGLSPGITREQRLGVENLMKKAFANLTGDLAGTYYPLTGTNEQVRQQLVDDHFLFVSGDPNLKVAGMERDWPEL